MSFEEDYSSQYLPVLALRLRCSQKVNICIGNLLVACSSTCLWMHVTAEISCTRNTGFLFSRYKGMPKANFQNTQWSCAADTLQCLSTGSTSWALEHLRSTRSMFEGSPRSWEGPVLRPALLQGSRRQWGLRQAQLHPACSRGPEHSQNLYLSQPESN